MDAITIDQLNTQLAQNLEQQEIERIILETIEEMKHFKQVNKRFTDRLEEKGLSAWIYKERETDKLNARKKENGTRQEAMRMYKYGFKLTWEIIKEQLATYNLKEYEAVIRKRIAVHSQDIETLKEIHAFLETKTTYNAFHYKLNNWKDDLGYCIRNSQK